jgi:hypothetical protein
MRNKRFSEEQILKHLETYLTDWTTQNTSVMAYAKKCKNIPSQTSVFRWIDESLCGLHGEKFKEAFKPHPRAKKPPLEKLTRYPPQPPAPIVVDTDSFKQRYGRTFAEFFKGKSNAEIEREFINLIRENLWLADMNGHMEKLLAAKFSAPPVQSLKVG